MPESSVEKKHSTSNVEALHPQSAACEQTNPLQELFNRQAELNKRTGFDPHALRENFDPQVAGQWLNNYLAAMSSDGG